MSPINPDARRIFVLDTNVLMHDPAAIFRFKEHDIHLPMVVLEELDAAKKGMSEASRNARQASRFLDELMTGASKAEIDAGLALPSGLSLDNGADLPAGRLFFETRVLAGNLPDSLPGNLPDNSILATALTLQKANVDARVTLVSKDINLRIKAAILGVHAEDYYNDRTLDDVDLLFNGVDALPDDFWESHSKDMDSWKDEGRTFYKISRPPGRKLAYQPAAVPREGRTHSKRSYARSKATRQRSN